MFLTLPLIYVSFSLLRGLLILAAVQISRLAGSSVYIPMEVRRGGDRASAAGMLLL